MKSYKIRSLIREEWGHSPSFVFHAWLGPSPYLASRAAFLFSTHTSASPSFGSSVTFHQGEDFAGVIFFYAQSPSQKLALGLSKLWFDCCSVARRLLRFGCCGKFLWLYAVSWSLFGCSGLIVTSESLFCCWGLLILLWVEFVVVLYSLWFSHSVPLCGHYVLIALP